MSHEHSDHAQHPHSAQEWDERYSSEARVWTDQVNPALAREAASLPPGRALDVGSGEGADARWLADHGWTVVAVDISQVALDRAAAMDSRETISWVRADLTVDPVPGGPFDLVSLQYFPLAVDRGEVLDRLFAALAPGGTLLMVAHDEASVREHGRNPDEYVQPAAVAARFGDRLEVQILESLERGRPAGGAAAPRHMNDVVLKARRRPAAG